MISFRSFAVTLLLASAQSESLRAMSNRRLSFELLGGYAPGSLITDHAALDLDQKIIEEQLAEGTTTTFAAARAIYEQGGHSKSFALVTVEGGAPSAFPAGTEIVGKNEDGDEVRGKALSEVKQGDTTISVQYKVNEVQKNYVGCQVGALPLASAANLDGCLASNGTLQVTSGASLSYAYNKRSDNNNGRTIAGFSTGAKSKMYECDNCPYPDFKKFYDYYGEFDYGNQWVVAAFTGTSTSFSNGNADFSSYGFTGKAEAIKKGAAYLNIFMYVIREMEDALDDCQEGCTLATCNEDPVHAWDEAVGFYTGSLEGADGSGDGKLLYALADKRCKNFKSCGPKSGLTSGTSKVNHDIFELFKKGKQNLLDGKCEATRPIKERIAQLMYVPMVQGTLRYAHITENDDESGEKGDSEGATFAAAVLPMVHACNPADASTIYENMRVGFGDADFSKVKAAFEKNYGCMKISCEDVGGLYDDANKKYFPEASPCGGSSDKNTVGIAVGATVGVLVVLFLGVVILRRRPSTVDHKFSSSDGTGVN